MRHPKQEQFDPIRDLIGILKYFIGIADLQGLGDKF